MTEPSVLDYIKSLFNPKLPRIRLSDYADDRPDRDELLTPSLDAPVDSASSSLKVVKQHVPISWRISAGVISLLLGQLMFEPPNQKLWVGLGFYILGAFFIVLSILLKEWNFSELPEETVESELSTWMINWKAFGFATLCLILAFLFFKDDKFNFLNLFFWIFSILGYVQAFSEHDLIAKTGQWILNIFKRKYDFSKDIKVTWWHVLIFITFLVIVFFRFYQLNQVPGEMFSDHWEKLADVSDILDGQYNVYFPRNTGREGFQMYLTALIAIVLHTGISFISLKIGTALAGIFTLPFIYLLGKEIANKRVGLIAFLIAGIAYWPNVIARVGLRFPLYPLFAAPALYYLIRGLRHSRKRDFILSGIFLGIGLHGYSPARMIPIVIVIGVLIYLFHKKTKTQKIGSLYGLIVVAMIAFVVFLPLFHYALGNMDMFSYRAMTRLGTLESPYPGNPFVIFLQNLFASMVMFFWKNGTVWVHSVPNRPALDVISAVFYFIGSVYLIIRYIQKRNWVDLFLLLAVPLLMMPSILSLAFPGENPSLNRSGGAIIPVFVITAIGLEGFLNTLVQQAKSVNRKPVMAGLIGLLFFSFMLTQNYSLVFDEYKTQFYNSAWNSSDMGEIITSFATTYGDYEHAYVVPYDYWVDTTLVGIVAQKKVVNVAIWPDQFESTLEYTGPKLFILKSDDYSSIESLQSLYPFGTYQLHEDQYPGKDFLVFFVPPTVSESILPEP